MGRSYTPRYVVQMTETPPPGLRVGTCYTTPMEWRVREKYGRPGEGKPTAENLERYVMAYAASLSLGGTNAHISKALGYIPYPNGAVIKDQKNGGKIVAHWKAAMFQVFPSAREKVTA